MSFDPSMMLDALRIGVFLVHVEWAEVVVGKHMLASRAECEFGTETGPERLVLTALEETVKDVPSCSRSQCTLSVRTEDYDSREG